MSGDFDDLEYDIEAGLFRIAQEAATNSSRHARHTRLINVNLVATYDQIKLEVVATAADGGEAVWLSQRLQPDVCLLDIRMSNMDGIEAARLLATLPDPIPVVIITTFNCAAWWSLPMANRSSTPASRPVGRMPKLLNRFISVCRR